MTEGRAGPGSDTIAFASLLSGAYASAAVALFFLVIDTMRGEPLFTPSLMGSVVLLGEAPALDLPIHLDMVAYYSVIHLAAFTLLGTVASLAWARLFRFRRQPVLLAGGILALLLAGELLVGAFWLPGLLVAIGPVAVGAANVAASVVMAGFIHRTVGDTPAEAVSDAAARPVR